MLKMSIGIGVISTCGILEGFEVKGGIASHSDTGSLLNTYKIMKITWKAIDCMEMYVPVMKVPNTHNIIMSNNTYQ